MDELELQRRNQQYKAKISYIENIFATKIDDPNIRKFIFNATGYKKCSRSVPEYVGYINNIMKLAFVFAYGCFRTDYIVEPFCCEKAKKTGSLRIINCLKKAYSQYPVTSDLIQFVLTDIQFDMIQGKGSELSDVFYHMCNFSDSEFSLSKYFKLIKDWLSCPARFTMDPNELADRFVLILENMSFLSDYSLVEENGDFCFVEKKAALFGRYGKFSQIPANHLIYKNDEKYFGFFTLFSCERIADTEQKLALRYLSNDGYSSINVLVSQNSDSDDQDCIIAHADEYYSEITGLSWPMNDSDEGQNKDTNANFINQVHTINYKYIKNLALAVSDAISSNAGSKKALLDTFRVRHPNIFVKDNGKNDILGDNADWDGITVMLLIEASPTKVLEVLFHKVPQTFYDVATNLCKRIDNPDMPIYGCDETYLKQKVQAVIRANLIVDEASGFNRKSRDCEEGSKLFAKAAAMLIISSLSSVMEGESDEKLICVGNIRENLSLLTKMSSDPSDENKEKKVSLILGETFRHLLCFYKGIVSYGAIKAIFDNESSDFCLSQSRIASYQAQLKDAFMSAANAEAERLASYDSSNSKDSLSLLEEFIKLCKQCSSSEAGETFGRSLYVTLGKYEIMNVNDFENRTAELIDDLKNLDSFSPKITEHYTRLALDVLKFLVFGVFDQSSFNGVPMNAIYPFAATYSRGNENYDGYKTATFSLNIDIESDEGSDTKEDVNVLTEFSYAPGDVFYCLPNVLRSNKKWWIDPLLVSFKEFNDIFLQ